MRVCIYLPALIDNTTYTLIHSEYLSLFMFNFMLLLAPTHIVTKSNTNTSHNSQNHSINKNDSVLHLCVQWHTQTYAHRTSTPNAVKSIDSVSSPELKHIWYYYVKSFCFMNESIEFMRSICSKCTNDTVFYYIHKAIQLFVLHSIAP